MHGINHGTIADSDTIVSAASCTTNAITPVLKAINDEYGVVHGHVETVHSFTNDQNLIDNFHKGDRRGRSAALNMVHHRDRCRHGRRQGAARTAGQAHRQLHPRPHAGRLDGHPEPEPGERDHQGGGQRLPAATCRCTPPLRKQIDYIDSPEVVSTDFVGSRRAGIVDGLATISNGKNLVLYVWYDNEFGYSCQVVRVMEEMAGVNPPSFPAKDAASILEAAGLPVEV